MVGYPYLNSLHKAGFFANYVMFYLDSPATSQEITTQGQPGSITGGVIILL